MTETFTWLVTGTSRGIGLEVVRQLVASPSNVVIATCRNPDGATALKSLLDGAKGKLHIAQIDVADAASIRASVGVIEKFLDNVGLDYLINNAAITEGDDKAFNFSVEGFTKTLQANVVGPALLAQTYVTYIEKSHRKVILNMTSGLGSFGLDFGARNATYSTSKTAVNMWTYKQASERPDLIVFSVDPGWVKTDMGGESAPLEPHESVSAIIQLLQSATKEQSGKSFQRDGIVIPW